jgi:S-DNA-T family DNA segregation ATPase FtsK/SpoIIIE
VSGSGPDRLHVHVVDRGGGALASAAAQLSCVGTAIAGDDPLRTVRLVHRLGEEVARRRSAPSEDDPRILLLVDGVESICALLDDADPARGSAELLRVVREGAAVGLTCVLTADRAVPGGRLAGMAQHRLLLPLPDRADYAVAGVPPAAVPSTRPPGRALVGEDAVECQLVLPPPVPGAADRVGTASGHRPPLRIVDLDPDPLVDGALDQRARASLSVAIGPGGDEGGTLRVDLLRAGGLLVLGPPGSGRSAMLDAVARDLVCAAVPVLRLRGPMAGPGPGVGGDEVDCADARAVADWLAAHDGVPVVVQVDDLGPAGSAAALPALPQLGAAGGVVLMAAGTAADVSTWFQGPVGVLRRSRSGLLLTPGPGDADVLGVRLPRTPVPGRPGSGWLVRAGVPHRVQVARHRGGPAPGQSSSSTGPISCVAYQASS